MDVLTERPCAKFTDPPNVAVLITFKGPSVDIVLVQRRSPARVTGPRMTTELLKVADPSTANEPRVESDPPINVLPPTVKELWKEAVCLTLRRPPAVTELKVDTLPDVKKSLITERLRTFTVPPTCTLDAVERLPRIIMD